MCKYNTGARQFSQTGANSNAAEMDTGTVTREI